MSRVLSVYFLVAILLYSAVSEEHVNPSNIGNATTSDVKNKEVSKNNDLAKLNKSTSYVNTAHRGREGVDPSLYTEGGQIQGVTKSQDEIKALPTNLDRSLDILSAEHLSPKSPVHGRKGAPAYSSAEDNSSVHGVSADYLKSSTTTSTNSLVNTHNSSIPSVPMSVEKTTPQIIASSSTTTTTTTTTTTAKPLPKKPQITVHSEDVVPPINFVPISKEAPNSTTVKVSTSETLSEKSNKMEKSTTPVIISVLEESVDSSVTKEKYQFREYFNPINKQPGYIIPIVITLLAVPMLGLIGYQAIRKGKEAWRNRHYRRMDFLIDGMYND